MYWKRSTSAFVPRLHQALGSATGARAFVRFASRPTRASRPYHPNASVSLRADFPNMRPARATSRPAALIAVQIRKPSGQ